MMNITLKGIYKYEVVLFNLDDDDEEITYKELDDNELNKVIETAETQRFGITINMFRID